MRLAGDVVGSVRLCIGQEASPVGAVTELTNGEVRATLHVNHENIAEDVAARFRIDGTGGPSAALWACSRTIRTASPTRWNSSAGSSARMGGSAILSHGAGSPMRSPDNLGTVELIGALYRS
jgi:hypothetical protein